MGLVIELAERIGNRLGEGNMPFGWSGNRLVKERQKHVIRKEGRDGYVRCKRMMRLTCGAGSM